MAWNILADPPKDIILDIIREFYVNAKPSDDDIMISMIYWVRGNKFHMIGKPYICT